MTLAAAPLTEGTIIGAVIAVALTLVLIPVLVWASTARPDPYGFPKVARIGVATLALVAVWGFWLLGMWPLAYDYHHLVPIQGRVEQINKRMVSDGDGGTSQRFVAVITGRPYGIDDTRAALLKVGDSVALACTRQFEWGVPRDANGWVCRWRGVAR